MNYSHWGILIPVTVIIITLLLTYIFSPSVVWVVVHLDEDESHDFPSYEDCNSICGNSTIRYPFGKCGLLSTHCVDNQTIIFLGIHGRVVGDITEFSYSTKTLQIVQDIGDPPVTYSYSGIFRLSKGYTQGLIYNCAQQSRDIPENMTWLDWGETDSHYLFTGDYINYQNISGCTLYSGIIVPADKKYNISADKNLEQLLRTGFQITWAGDYSSTIQDCESCEASGGICYAYSCLCRNGDPHNKNCTNGEHPIGKITTGGVMAGIFLGECGLFSMVVVLCIVVRSQSRYWKQTNNEEEQSILELPL